MKLERIKVEGFKSIKEMNLQLRDLNVLIGANGSGKSNFIAVFKLLNQIVEQNLNFYVRQSGGPDNFLYFGTKITDRIRIALSFDPNGYEAVLVPTRNNSLIFFEENYWYHNSSYDQSKTYNLGKGHEETKLVGAAKKDRPAAYVLESIRDWKIYHFHDTSDTAKVKGLADIGDNRILKPDASNLAAFLYRLQQTTTQYYDIIVQTIRLTIPFFDNFVLRPTPENPNKIKLEWRERGHPDSYFDAHYLSDGTLRFICLATLLLQATLPSTILLDEPELGLHPHAIILLASMLKSAATKTQVIVSTQSVPLVNQFEPKDIIVVDKEDDQSTFKHLDEQYLSDWLTEYTLGDLWEKNIIGGRPH